MAAPARLDHFRILWELGRGGMGVVYEAEDEQLRRRVAVKVLPDELARDEARRGRFLREARTAAALAHPNVATIYAIGESDGYLFIAMELVEGRPLRELLAERRLGWNEVVAVATAVADALAAAHDKGIAHRDLKPENVMVSSSGAVKLLDFGIAKALAPTTGDAGPTTQDGQILGTPGYMSPEQARGDRADHRADVFSFGVLLYELVSGRAPFVGPTPMDRIAASLRDEAPPVAEAPPPVQALIARCLRKNPAERFQSGRELLDALQAATGTQPLGSPDATGVDVHASTVAIAGRGPPVVAGGASGTETAFAETAPGTAPQLSTASRRTVGAVLPWVMASAVAVAALLVALYVTRARDDRAPSVPSAPVATASRSRAVHAPVREDAPGSSRDRGAAPSQAPAQLPLAFPCERLDDVTHTEAHCDGETRAWCDTNSKSFACCAPGLVPTTQDGACGCPPGGTLDDDAVEAGCERAERDGLDPAEIRRLVQSRHEVFRRCFERELRKNQKLQGKLKITLRVAPSGEVFSSRIKSSSFPSGPASECVLTAWRRIRFPPVPGGNGVSIDYPIVFATQ